MSLSSGEIKRLAHACGFEIAGVTPALPHPDFSRFESWYQSGKAAELAYLTDHRAGKRADPKSILPSAQSIICLGKLYNTDRPLSIDRPNPAEGWISRYAWGRDYHDTLRPRLEQLVRQLTELHGAPFDSKICVDTAPLLERSYARAAGLGWIGRNTCLINQHYGSWFFLAELLVNLPISADPPVDDFCGTCTRCIQACPTHAIVPHADNGFEIDAGLCISYLTIEKHGAVPAELALLQGRHIFGCDICQDVCPWNQRAHRHESDLTTDESFAARIFAPDLAELGRLQDDEFRRQFRETPIWRTRYSGFLRNVAIAMGNSGKESMREPLRQLTLHPIYVVAEAAHRALVHLQSALESN